MLRIFLHITLFVLSFSATAQVQLTPVLVGCAGGYYTYNGGSISVSAGEAIITTVNNSNIILTQGFQQPRILSDSMVLEINTYAAECKLASNGAFKINVRGGTPDYTFSYEIKNNNGDFELLEHPFLTDSTDSINGLAPGIYRVKVSDYYSNSVVDTFTIGISYEGDCKIKIYSGFSPNGDGVNDNWIIDGIEYYPNNSVFIFNRWGDKLWETTGYNNQDKVWNGYSQITGELLVNGTYYYIVNVEDKQFKGWVELTR